MILFIHLTSKTIVQKAVSTCFFCFARCHERSPSVSHPRHSRWQGWIGREGWAARHLRNPHGDVMSNRRTKKQKKQPNVQIHRCMMSQRHTLLIHTSCTRQKHIMQTWWHDTYQTYPNTQKENTPRALDMQEMSERNLMWACKICQIEINQINVKIRETSWRFLVFHLLF